MPPTIEHAGGEFIEINISDGCGLELEYEFQADRIVFIQAELKQIDPTIGLRLRMHFHFLDTSTPGVLFLYNDTEDGDDDGPDYLRLEIGDNNQWLQAIEELKQSYHECKKVDLSVNSPSPPS